MPVYIDESEKQGGDNVDDRELLEGIKNQDSSCLELLMDKYGAYVAAIVSYVGKDHFSSQDVEEVAADVFISLWGHSNKMELQGGSIKSYIAAIARNKAKTLLTSRKLSFLPLLEDTLGNGDTVDEYLVAREAGELVKQTVCEMDELYREIFIRRYFYFEKISDIAKILSMNKKTVETRLIRGREKLRKVFVERGVCI